MKYEITKGSEKDFELAPEWATLKERNTSGDLFFSEGHSVGCRVQGITTEHDFTIDDGNNDFTHLTLIAERRPITEPVWDGEGLMPSVGMKCLAKQCSQINADEFLVVAIKDSAVFGFWTATAAPTGLDVNRWIFLPIHSPEDVARDEAIAKMISILNEGTSTQDDARDIYDAIAAGKIPGVKLE